MQHHEKCINGDDMGLKFRIGSKGGLCEHSNEPAGSMKKAGCFSTS